MGASISRSLMPAVISRFHQQHPQVKVRIMEGQLVSMINELRQGELDFTINTYYQGPYDHEFTFEKLLEKQFAIFCRPGHPAIGARSIKQLLDYSWTMPTPHGSYYKQLSELLDDQAQTPQVGVVLRDVLSLYQSGGKKRFSQQYCLKKWAAIPCTDRGW